LLVWTKDRYITRTDRTVVAISFRLSKALINRFWHFRVMMTNVGAPNSKKKNLTIKKKCFSLVLDLGPKKVGLLLITFGLLPSGIG